MFFLSSNTRNKSINFHVGSRTGLIFTITDAISVHLSFTDINLLVPSAGTSKIPLDI